METNEPDRGAAPGVRGQRPAYQAGLRLLSLVPFAPRLDADHGGGRAVAQLLIRLAARHRVALCCLRTASEPPPDPALRERCALVEDFVLPELLDSKLNGWRQRLHSWGELLAGKPLWASGRFDAAYQARVVQLANSWAPDIIQVEYHIMGQYLPALAGCRAPRILVQHEPGQAAAGENRSSAFARGRFQPALDHLAWQRFERTVFRQVEAVVVFTERDRTSLMQSRLAAPLVRIPLGADLPAVPLNPVGTQPLSLLFVGNFLHLPNIDAAVRLITAIFPPVQARFPGSRLYIVGRHAPPEIQSRASESVIVTGYLPDLTPYLDRAAIFIVPLRLGGGMRVKVLEALANGKAVLASTLAIEGLDLEDGRQVVLAESDQEFSQAAIDLLSAPELRAGLAGEARTWACANLSWEKTVAAYEDLYHRLLLKSNEAEALRTR